MEVIPAIDLRGGRCVRLTQGDYGRERVFDDDPVAAGLRWQQAGARRLHVVDLDGARGGVRVNAGVVKALASALDVLIQLSGGIRDAAAARELVETGMDRVVFGTAAIEVPAEVAEAVRRLGAERVVAGIDARDGIAASHGWTEQSGMRAIDLMLSLADMGVRRFMYTDITRDGTLQHPSFDSISEIINAVGYPVIVAGGIATVDDLVRLAELGAEGAVTGMAIYTGAIDLQEAIKAVEGI